MIDRPFTRVAIVSTHPIQYHVPWFHRLARVPGLEIKVFFGMIPNATQQGVGFDTSFEWDIPLLEGYHWECLTNVAKPPRLSAFFGCNTPGIYRALQSWRPDVIVLTGWHSRMMFQALWAAFGLRIPKIVRGESNALRPRPRSMRIAHRVLMKAFDGFLAIGGANRRFYEQAGVSCDRIFDCPYFIDNERFSNTAEKLRYRRAALRERWEITDEQCCFVYAGKMIHRKRPLDLIHALAKAQKRGLHLRLLIVGTGELLDEAKALTEQWKLPVTFAGFLNQSEIVEAYVAADCSVLPSDTGETWGLVVNEAMACGIPAIVSDQVGCAEDLIIEGETGSVFPMGDVEALADKLASLAADRESLQKMGEKAQQRVCELYSVDKAMEGTLAAIHATTKNLFT